ncbi:hypothetical protein QCB45_08585 [Thiomicrorhabdus sp. ZW0627]|uniref:hypothetical protein n=1 Tax=Thiomicrorhabdus sp. ZW0627 TaxID=3039774 RepID=UPI002436D798|nr:hypothetical protein [Thiomicrorhabdus sp. ZW0627]MDG6774388.1 hypothetical protein [Thiomicrorhabdus sp. ZW0627]
MDKSDDPLLEWNRLNNENAEQGFVSGMFQSMSETSPIVDKFSMWLFAGTGATGALLISQIQSVLPYLSKIGFLICLAILVISAVTGFIAKFYALRCEIQNSVQRRLSELLQPILDKHANDKDQIQEIAEQNGIEVDTEIKLSNIIEEFSKPLPFWVKWLIKRQIEQKSGDRQAGLHIAVKAHTAQLGWTFIQATLFLLFMLAATYFAYRT